ncbi:MAG: PDZ domain-containing protein [Chloroflexi bacterium]|nr:PDZ domain-containing protein [Chloroflexota bacterium]
MRPDSLAARAGLQEGDIIIRLNDKAIHNIDNLLTGLQAVASLKVENPDLTFWRDDRKIEGHLPVQFS